MKIEKNQEGFTLRHAPSETVVSSVVLVVATLGLILALSDTSRYLPETLLMLAGCALAAAVSGRTALDWLPAASALIACSVFSPPAYFFQPTPIGLLTVLFIEQNLFFCQFPSLLISDIRCHPSPIPVCPQTLQ